MQTQESIKWNSRERKKYRVYPGIPILILKSIDTGTTMLIQIHVYLDKILNEDEGKGTAGQQDQRHEAEF